MKEWLKTAKKRGYSLFLAIQSSEIGNRALLLFSKGANMSLKLHILAHAIQILRPVWVIAIHL